MELSEATERTETPASTPESVTTPPVPDSVLMATLAMPLKSNVPPLTVRAPSKPVSPPRAAALPILRVPALTVVPPRYELAPESVCMPAPDFTTARLPVRVPAYV